MQIDLPRLAGDVFDTFVFTLSTGPSPLVPETTRKTLTAVGSQTAAFTAERLSKSPANLLGTYEYTQVSEKHRKRG